jgi:hypothetical protein
MPRTNSVEINQRGCGGSKKSDCAEEVQACIALPCELSTGQNVAVKELNGVTRWRRDLRTGADVAIVHRQNSVVIIAAKSHTKNKTRQIRLFK